MTAPFDCRTKNDSMANKAALADHNLATALERGFRQMAGNGKAKRRTAPEIIGFHLCWDMADVSDGRYQPSRYYRPAVYVCGDDYYCAPSAGQKLPGDWPWTEVGEYYGRKVYSA